MPHVDLLELPYFQGISFDSVCSLVELMEPRHFAAGAVIVQEGDPTPQPLYIATSGKILISKRGLNGEERRLAELNTPTLFGEIELFCQIRAVATARALTSVATFTLNRPTFEKLYAAQHPAIMGFTFNVARVACHRLAIADEIMTQFVTGEDLVKIRRTVFAQMSHGDDWGSTTGVFTRPPLK